MPVTVSVPVRIRTDAPALMGRWADLTDALASASARALAVSKEVVVDARGGYVGVRLHAPTFVWSGDGLADVPDDVRAEVEASLSALLQDLSADLGLLDAADSAEDLPLPLSEPPEEIPLAGRYHPRLLRYVVPSYEGEGETVAVPVDEPEPEPMREVTLWLPSSSLRGGAFWDRVREAIERYGDFDRSGVFGVAFMHQGGLAFSLAVPNADGSFDDLIFALPSLSRPRFNEATSRYENPPGLPAPGRGTLRVHGPFSSPEDASSLIRPELDRITRQTPKPDNLSQQEHEAALQEVRELLTRIWVGRISASQPNLLEARIGGAYGFAPVDAWVMWQGDADVLPLTEVRQRPETDEGSVGQGQTSDGGGNGGQRARGGIVDAGGDGQAEDAPLYPPAQYRRSTTADCSAFEGEPSLDNLGEDGTGLRDGIEELAAALGITPCAHAGRFCLNAVRAIAGRAYQVGAHSVSEAGAGGFSEPVEREEGNLGTVEFRPTASPAIQYMRHLAGLVRDAKLLAQATHHVYTRHADKITGTWACEVTSWALQLFKAFSPALDRAVAAIFAETCRVILMQLLRSSAQHIQARLDLIEPYAEQFEAVVVPRLARLEDLLELRDQLQTYERLRTTHEVLGYAVTQTVTTVTAAALPGFPPSPWADAAREMVEVVMEMEARADADPNAGSGPHQDRGRIIEAGGVARIADGRGRYRSLDQLEEAILFNRGMLESVDPLIKQLIELDEVMERFRDSNVGVKEELERVLNEMKASNEEMQGNVAPDALYAFRASAIREDIQHRTVPYSRYALGGVHLLAHQQIGEFFRDDEAYGQGLNYLFGVELGRQGLLVFGEVVGLIALALVCPPLAVAVGVGTAVYHVSEAHEKERLYEALMDPELVITRAEIEAELFGAYLGLALSVLPGAGKALGKGATAAVRQGVRQTARQGLGRLGRVARLGPRGAAAAGARSVRQHLTRAVVEQMKRDILVELAKEVATDRVFDALLQQVLTPVIQRVQRETSLTGPAGGMQGAEQTIAVERARRARERRSRERGDEDRSSPSSQP